MNRTRHLTAAAAAVVATLTLAPGAARAQQGRDESTFTWSKRLSAGAMLTILNGSGPISVREASGDAVEVRAEKRPRSGGSIRDVAFDVRERRDGVEICTLYDGRTSCDDRGSIRNMRVRVDYTVSIPRSMRLKVATGNGAITIERAGAEVSASTGNGPVTIGETEGRVDANTGNGNVQVNGANGPVSVNTGSGRITVSTARGAVDANTGSGEIDVRIGSTPLDGAMRFNSGSGAIRLTLPADFNGRIDASSGNGTLRSDFEISVVGRFDAQHIRGSIGRGGGPVLRMTTGNGTIELRKGT